MFTHVNLIMSDRMPWKADFLAAVAGTLNARIGYLTSTCFVRAIYDGKSPGGQHHAHVKVIGLRPEHAEVIRKVITAVLNECFVDDDTFLFYSFSNGDRVLESR